MEGNRIKDIRYLVGREFGKLTELTNSRQQPNINDLWNVLKDLNAIKWSVKQHGYAIGAQVFDSVMQSEIPKVPVDGKMWSGCSTQRDVESAWFRYWAHQIQTAPIPHRKLWEFAYILQNLSLAGKLRDGMHAVGFGCGQEPLPSYLTNLGISVTITDLHPEVVQGKGWVESGQHTEGLDSSFYPNLVDRTQFDTLATLEYVDMNAIPADMSGKHDFCWSVCALEHLGSISNGLDFVRNSLDTLKPGGVAVHTTEFNYSETERTIDNWPTVLFLRRHIEELAATLRADGHDVAPLSFDVGCKPLDAFIDLPPFDFDNCLKDSLVSGSGHAFHPGHLKISIDGFPATCIGLTITKAG